jgi:Tol biopolymer transport system component
VAISLATATVLVSSASATFPGRNGLLTYIGWTARCDASDVFTASREGGGRRRLTDYRCGDSSAQWPVWSPNGRRILYVEYVDNPANPITSEFGVFVMRSDGSRRKVVATDTVHSVEWGPDGRTLAWSMFGDEARIYVGPFTNPRERFIAYGSSPSWSPDGKSLAVIESGGAHESCSQLSVYDVATAQHKRVVVAPIERDAQPCSNMARTPDWSPNGRRIAYVGSGSRSGGDARNNDIYVIGRNGHDVRRLTRNRASESRPRWSPDGRWITYDSVDFDDRSKNGLYMMRSDGTNKRRIGRYAGAASWQPLPKR